MDNNGLMESTVQTLEAVHRDLLARLQGGDESLAAIVESVPQLVALVERYVPEADAVIFTRAELRDLVTSVVADVLQTQARRSIRPRRKHARPLA
jgi:hypothetical protein